MDSPNRSRQLNLRNPTPHGYTLLYKVRFSTLLLYVSLSLERTTGKAGTQQMRTNNGVTGPPWLFPTRRSQVQCELQLRIQGGENCFMLATPMIRSPCLRAKGNKEKGETGRVLYCTVVRYSSQEMVEESRYLPVPAT